MAYLNIGSTEHASSRSKTHFSLYGELCALVLGLLRAATCSNSSLPSLDNRTLPWNTTGCKSVALDKSMLSVDDTYCRTKCLPGYGYKTPWAYSSAITSPWDAWVVCQWYDKLGAKWRWPGDGCISCGAPPSLTDANAAWQQCDSPYPPGKLCRGTCLNGGSINVYSYCSSEGTWQLQGSTGGCTPREWFICGQMGALWELSPILRQRDRDAVIIGYSAPRHALNFASSELLEHAAILSTHHRKHDGTCLDWCKVDSSHAPGRRQWQ